jgi:hypothetical protein
MKYFTLTLNSSLLKTGRNIAKGTKNAISDAINVITDVLTRIIYGIREKQMKNE